LRQLGWREFNHHLLFQAPDLAERPLQAAFEVFPWRDDEAQFRRWCLGMTGFPIVDAGQRELWQTGWMHNRVRMISASFLVKDLLLPWQWGEAWMWDTLVDACPANNPANWQWVAGCGADAAPYFRVFNPTLQAQKFDPDGAYQREWVPESVHPGAGGDLFASPARYPRPMVDHAAARVRALEALQQMKDDADR
jgi:deoxyribodipyrimidine photo-lyase